MADPTNPQGSNPLFTLNPLAQAAAQSMAPPSPGGPMFQLNPNPLVPPPSTPPPGMMSGMMPGMMQGMPPAAPPPPPTAGLSPALAALVATPPTSQTEEDAARAILSNIVKASQRSTNLTEAVKGKSAEDAANAVRDLYSGLSKEQNPGTTLLDAGFLPGEELEMQIMPNSVSLRIAQRTLAALKAGK